MKSPPPRPRFQPRLEVLEDRLALAAPVRTPVSIPDQFTLTGVCSSDVQVDVLTNKEVATTLSNGNVITTGALKVRLTNVDTGKSVVLNISGPSVTSPDGTTITGGPWLFFFPTDNTQGQDAGLLLIHGRTES